MKANIMRLLGLILFTAVLDVGCRDSADCTPDCVGKLCGDDDGCGGMCTTCPTGQICNASTWQC